MKKIIFTFIGLLLTNVAIAAQPLKVTYGLYAGGFNVVDIDGTYTLNGDQYDLEMDLKTNGMLETLAPWSGEIKSAGVNKNDRVVPKTHFFSSTWRGDTEKTTFTFDKNGTLQSRVRVDENGKVYNDMPNKDVYIDNPVDMLSALYKVMSQSSCAGSVPGFDKKRRFNMVFESKGETELTKSRYSNFAGNAEVCTIEIVPVAGQWHDKPRGWMSIQEQAKNNGQLPRLWFGRVRDDMPKIPVRFQIKTNYGTMIMHLKSIR